MTSIIPVPSTRTSDLLLSTRLLQQLQTDQRDLLEMQTRLSTGRRFAMPSEDPSAASRAIGLQRLLEQKEQLQVNLNTSQSYLAATDTTISSVHSLLADIRGTALGVATTTASDAQRRAASAEVLRAVEQMVDVGNRSFRGRYLFAGSDATSKPFSMSNGAFVRYDGNEESLRSFSDLDMLFASNVTGDEVFGAISAERKGTVDLNPQLTIDTRLADLNGGQGVGPGSIAISDGTTISTIDVASAETVGDVIDLIEAAPPAGRQLTARITGGRLAVDIDDAPNVNLTIREVNGGTTASELGILENIGTGTNPKIGDDLNPVLRTTTPLSQILGTRATALVESPGTDDDLFVESIRNGDAGNGLNIVYVDDSLLRASGGLTAGNETVVHSGSAPIAARAALAFNGTNNNLILSAVQPGAAMNGVSIQVANAGNIGNAAQVGFDADNNVLTIGIDQANRTTVETVIQTIDAQGTFTAAYDPSVPGDGGYVPGATILTTDAGAVTGNTGVSGADPNTVQIHVDVGDTRSKHVIAALQNDAAFAADYSVRVDGKDSTSEANAGEGFVEVTAGATTGGGSGVDFDKGSGIQIVNGQKTHTLVFQHAETIEDVLNTINGSGAGVIGQLNASRTGIDVRSTISGADFHIGENGGTTATALGLRTLTLDSRLADFNHGLGVHTSNPLDGTDGTDFTIRTNNGKELEIDISTAETVADLLDLINNHVDNQVPGETVSARLASVGNGIQLVDDDPIGTGTLQIEKSAMSEAAWDLGLIPRGENIARSSDAPPPSGATATIRMAAPNDVNNGIYITTTQPGADMNGIGVVFEQVPAGARLTFVGDPNANNDLLIEASQPGAGFDGTRIDVVADLSPGVGATAQYDADSGVITLRIQANGATQANELVAAFATLDEFTARLDTSVDTSNNGTDTIDAAAAGVGLATLRNTDAATVVLDRAAGTLTIGVDPAATTANTVVAAVNAEATFAATLDRSYDPTNNGSGLIADAGLVATTAGGTPNTTSDAASATVTLAAPNDANTALTFTATGKGTSSNGIGIQYVDDSLLQAGPSVTAGSENVVYSGSSLPARASLALSGMNNDLIFTAAQTGTLHNNVEIRFVDAGAIGDAAQVAYDAVNKTLTIGIDTADQTTVGTLIGAVNADGNFTAVYDASDPADGNLLNAGAAVRAADVGVVTGDTGNSGGDARTLFIHVEAGVTTANHVLAAVNDQSTLFNVTREAANDATNDGTGTVVADGAIATTAGGTAEVLTSSDTNPLETSGIFNTLIRLNDALLSENLNELERVMAELDEDLEQISFVRAELGARSQGLDVLNERLVDEDIELRSALSDEIDVDLAKAISDLTAKQAVFQASLNSMAQTFNISLMDYI